MTWSIFGKCDACAPNPKTAPLSRRHRPLIGKLYHVLGTQAANHGEYFAPPIPLACEYSLEAERRCSSHLNGNMQTRAGIYPALMQTDPHEPKEGEETAAEPHRYNCDCQECQVKFGSLPLLVQVIECQEKAGLEGATAGSASTTSEPEPSTSSAQPSAASSRQKTMVCPHCSKSFRHRGDFNKHVRMHTGEQPYTCRVCKRRFAHTSNLKRHLRVHSGDRPFVCSACSKTFSRKDKLKMHKKSKLCKKSSDRGQD